MDAGASTVVQPNERVLVCLKRAGQKEERVSWLNISTTVPF